MFSFKFFLVTKTARSGLEFPVGRIQRHLREGRYARRIGTNAAVCLAGVLEYLSAEILELSTEAARVNKRHRITPRHIMTSIANDAEISVLLKNVTIPHAGVVPFIHPVLLPKSTKDKKNAGPMEMEEQVEQEEDEESDGQDEHGNVEEDSEEEKMDEEEKDEEEKEDEVSEDDG